MQPNAKAPINQSIQITLFFQFAFLMLKLRAQEFAPVTIPPPQPIAINENNAAQHATIIHTWSAMASGKERLKPSHLLVRQPEKIAHHSGSFRQPEPQSSLKINGS